MARADQIAKLLKQLVTNTPDVEASAVVDNDGLMIASALGPETDDDAVAAMSAALLGISERISSELRRGDFQMVMTQGAEGYIVIVRCGVDAVLTVLTTRAAKLGLIFMELRRASSEIGRMIA